MGNISAEINGVEDNGHITVTRMTIGGLEVDRSLWGFYLVAERELIRVGVESMDERVIGVDAIEKWLCTAGGDKTCKVCGELVSTCGGVVAYGLSSSPAGLQAFAIGAECFAIVKATVDMIQCLERGDCPNNST
jgi:hypothetical protein